jgi:uncharacterized repeat protein (TIGR03843 family)
MSTDELSHPLVLLREGQIEIEGRMPWSSNGTYLVTLEHEGVGWRAIYKPERGERPLWDFPTGLYRREVATYELSHALEFGVVPPTVVRDGPLGVGSVQWFVDADFSEHYFTIYEQRPELHDQLRAIAVLDLLANNTDRKGGHCLLGRDGRVHAIDNGLCFAAEPKLRTVIWEFGGQEIPEALMARVERVAESVPLSVAALLDDDEVEMVMTRAKRLVRRPVFPIDETGRRYPWPLV